MRIACDTGGTFTDLVVEDDSGGLHMVKAPTTPADPAMGILDAVGRAADGLGVSPRALLADCEMFIHGTTHAINPTTRRPSETSIAVVGSLGSTSKSRDSRNRESDRATGTPIKRPSTMSAIPSRTT